MEQNLNIPSFNALLEKSILDNWNADALTDFKGQTLQFHDVFRRLSDGYVFRVTDNIQDSETPARATFQIGQVHAERWDLT